MKLKHTNRIALRALAIMTTCAAAQAALVTVTTSPYVYPNAGINADTIQANAGGALITINATSTLTGNAAASPALSVNATGYTVTNLGTLTGNAAAGVTVAAAATNSAIVNSGNISGTVGIDFLGTTSVDTLTMNGGTIAATGTNAVNFGAGNDILNLKGGTITGIVDGGVGTDTLNIDVAGTATIAGNLTNFETISKTLGTGVATINGTTAATGITVSAGSLYLNGTTAATTITVGTGSLYLNNNVTSATEATINLGPGGELGGVSTVIGAVSSWDAVIKQTGGTLSAGTAPMTIGSLAIGIDVGAAPKLDITTAGTLLVHMDPRASAAQASDLVTVNGNASIVGATQIVVSPISLDAPLLSTRVLDVTGTRTDNYDAVSLVLEAGRTDAGPLQALTVDGPFTTSSTMALSVASGDALLGQDVDDTYVTVVHDYTNPALALSDFGVAFGASLNTMVAGAASDVILADFLGYLDYSDAATVANVMNAYEPTGFQESQAYSVVSAREIHRIVEQQNAGERMFPGSTHVWGNYNYSDYSSLGGSNRVTVGVGGAIDSLRFGALVSYAQSDLSDDADIESLAYGVYFGMGCATGWQWNAYIGGSNADTDSTIYPAASPQLYSATNFAPDGDGFQGLLSGAYMVDQESWTWGPTFGVEYTSAELDGSVVPGVNLPGMSYSADKLESLRSLLGLRAEFNAGSKVRPYVSAQWAHEFDGESNGYTASFQGGSFNVASPFELPSDSIIVRAGIVVGFNDSFFGDLGYVGEYSTDDDGADYSGLNVGLRASF